IRAAGLGKQARELRETDLAPAMASRDEAVSKLRDRVFKAIEEDLADAFAGDQGGARRLAERFREVGRDDLAAIATRETAARVEAERQVAAGAAAAQERLQGLGERARGLLGRFTGRVEAVRRD